MLNYVLFSLSFPDKLAEMYPLIESINVRYWRHLLFKEPPRKLQAYEDKTSNATIVE